MRRFRFGVGLGSVGGRAAWTAKCQKAERLGFDVVQVPDHLGALAPFPAVVAAAEATQRCTVGILVLNTGFYRPALLARDVVTTAELLDGRLELGLGSGHMKSEFDEAGLPWHPPDRPTDRHAAHRAGGMEAQMLIQKVAITNDPRGEVERWKQQLPQVELGVDELLQTPQLLVGTTEDIIVQVREQRERYGFSYFTVFEDAMDAFAPVVEALAGR